jgi:hypothetical protein
VRLVLFQIFFKEDEEVSVGLGFSERGTCFGRKRRFADVEETVFGCDDDGLSLHFVAKRGCPPRDGGGEVKLSFPIAERVTRWGNRLGYRRVG